MNKTNNVTNIKTIHKPDEPDRISKIEKQLIEIEHPSFKNFIQKSGDFINTDFPEKEYYLGHIIAEQQIILVPGWRGTGKTWFCLGIADAITTGKNFGPWETGKTAPVMYVDAELPPGDFKDRIKSLNPREERQSPLYVYNDCFMTANGIKRAYLTDEIWQNDIRDALLELGVKVVIFDNISSLTPGIEENSKKEWDPVNQFLLSLRFAGITSILPHHTSKEGKQRGTSGREDNIDFSILLKHPVNYNPDMGCEFIATFSKSRIPQKYLKEVRDIHFKLDVTDKGESVFTYNSVRSNESVILLLKEGWTQKEVAKEVGVSTGRISQIKKQSGLFDEPEKKTKKG